MDKDEEEEQDEEEVVKWLPEKEESIIHISEFGTRHYS